MSKLDLIKGWKSCYKAGQEPEIVEFGDGGYLPIAGKGEPNAKEFQCKAEALYLLAYGIKKICKEQGMTLVFKTRMPVVGRGECTSTGSFQE